MGMKRHMNSAFNQIGFPGWHSILDDIDAEKPTIVEEADHHKKYKLNLHLGDDFEPDDIQVKVKRHLMTIQAKSEHKSKDGRCRVYHEVSKTFTLPDVVDEHDVRSTLEPDGCLTIEAPWPQLAIK